MTNLEKWQYYCQDYESPELYISWGYYALIGAAIQRRVWFFSNQLTGMPSESSVFCNMYPILVGPPACGKSRIIALVKSAATNPLLKKAIPNGDSVKLVPSIYCTPDSITFEAFFPFLKEANAGVKKEIEIEGKKVNVLITHNSVIALIEELGVLLRKNTEDVVSVLNQCYDARNVSRRTQTWGTEEISNVCVSMLAGTTPDFIRRAMTNQVISEGFSSRVNFIFADKPRFYRGFRPISKEQQAAMNEIHKHVAILANTVCGEIKLTDEAEKYFDEVYESGKLTGIERINKDSKLDTYYGRKKMHWRKLASIHHFSERTDSMIVELESVKAAERILADSEVNMHLAFRAAGRNPLYDVATDIVKFIGQHVDGVSYKKLLLVFTRDATKVELDECMNYLNVTEQVKLVNNMFFAITKTN